jgi:hypothetical protein
VFAVRYRPSAPAVLFLSSAFSSFSRQGFALGPLRAPGPLYCVRCTFYLRVYSAVVTVRPVDAGSYRRVFILVIFREMFRVYTCTGTVFRHIRARALLWRWQATPQSKRPTQGIQVCTWKPPAPPNPDTHCDASCSSHWVGCWRHP